jgi:large subunit ribosomal protein L25
MKTVSLSGSPRENVGKKDASQVRAEGGVPCVVYGGKDQIHFSVNLIALSKFVYTPDVFKFELEVGGKKIEAILKDLQFDPVTDRIIHADFLEIIEGKPVKMELPVKLTGNALGVRNGGRLATNFRRINVSGLPKDFPDAVVLDITALRINQSIRVKDLELPGVTVLHNPEAIVVAVRTARGAVDEDEEEEGEEGEEAEGSEGGEATSEEANESAE